MRLFVVGFAPRLSNDDQRSGTRRCLLAFGTCIADPDGMFADGLGEDRSNGGGFRADDGAMPVRCVSAGADGAGGRQHRQRCCSRHPSRPAPALESAAAASRRAVSSPGRSASPYDANSRARTEIFRQCMYAAGWSEQVQSSTSTDMTPDTDWTKGFDVGMRAGQMRSVSRHPASPTQATGRLAARAARRRDSLRQPRVARTPRVSFGTSGMALGHSCHARIMQTSLESFVRLREVVYGDRTDTNGVADRA